MKEKEQDYFTTQDLFLLSKCLPVVLQSRYERKTEEQIRKSKMGGGEKDTEHTYFI